MKTKIILILLLILCTKYYAFDFQHHIRSSINTKSEQMMNYLFDIEHSYAFKSNSIDFFQSSSFMGKHFSDEIEMNYELYRLWLRLDFGDSELRIGKQKINFGQAKILRCLRWFDTLNFFDPTGESVGVPSILYRKYFLNNANLWIWGIYSTDKLKGNEIFQSKENNVEPGFRIQIPFKRTETGMSFHYRKRQNMEIERKIGVDFYLDYWIGFWCELNSIVSKNDNIQMITVGSDYSFDFFTTFHFTAETQYINFESNQDTNSVFNLDFPIGLFDQISFTFGSNWDEKNSISTMYSRNYDFLSFHLISSWSKQENEYAKLLLTYDF